MMRALITIDEGDDAFHVFVDATEPEVVPIGGDYNAAGGYQTRRTFTMSGRVAVPSRGTRIAVDGESGVWFVDSATVKNNRLQLVATNEAA